MNNCYADDLFIYKKMSSIRLFYQFFMCSSWVGLFTLVAVINAFWIGALFICHFYQVLYYITNRAYHELTIILILNAFFKKLIILGLTTNERINIKRYKHFYDKNGKYQNPFKYVQQISGGFCLN
jgi:hypothetical protein